MRVFSRPDWAVDLTMKRTRHPAEQIIRNLKTAEQLIAQGKTVADVCRVIELRQKSDLSNLTTSSGHTPARSRRTDVWL